LIKLVIVGFGNVGKSFAEKVLELEKSGGERLLEIAAIFSSKGGVVVKSRDDLLLIEKILQSRSGLESHPKFEQITFTEYSRENPTGIAVFAIPPSYDTGEPNLTLYRSAIESGYSVVTADKTGLALRYRELKDMAKRAGVFLKYTATVSAGTPVLSVAESLRHRRVDYVRGVLNSTSNFVLKRIEEGSTWERAIQDAVNEKLAEPNPSIDIDGLDAAAKLSILLNEMGVRISLGDIERKSLKLFSEEEIRSALKEGLKLKQVAGYDSSRREAFVKPVFVPLVSPLAFTEGIYNTVEFSLEGESILVHGPAGPAWRTANVLLSDTLTLADELLAKQAQ